MNNRFHRAAKPATSRRAVTISVVAFSALLLGNACLQSRAVPTPDLVPIAATKTGNASSSSRMSTHVAAQLKTTPQSFAPLSYFAANCARCHGPNGSFFGDSFGKNRDDASLRQIVHDMAFGPAQAPLDDARLEVLVAYNRSLIDKKPFVTLSSATLEAAKTTTKSSLKPVTNPKTAPHKKSKPKTPATKKPAAKTIPSKTQVPKSNTSISSVFVLKGEATPDAKVIVKQGAQTIQAQRTGDSWTATLPAASIASAIEITTEKDGIQTVLRPAQNAWSHAAMQAENTTVGAADKSK